MPQAEERKPNPYDLFNAALAKNQKWGPKGFSKRVAPEPQTLTAPEVQARLKEILHMTDQTVWARFDILETLWRSILQQHWPMPPKNKELLDECLKSVVSELCRTEDHYVGGRISNRLSLVLRMAGDNFLQQQADVVLNLCLSLTTDSSRDRRDRVALVDELINVWKNISQTKREVAAKSGKPQFILPTAEEFGMRLKALENDIIIDPTTRQPMDDRTKALAAIIDQFPIEESVVLAPALVATLATLGSNARPRMLGKAGTFLQLFRVALDDVKLDDKYFESIFSTNLKNFPEQHVDKLRQRMCKIWPSAEELLKQYEEWQPGEWGQNTLARDRSLPQTLNEYHKKLRHAYATDNTEGMVVLWSRFQQALRERLSLAEDLRDDPEHMDFWHFIWCAVGKPEQLQEAQELMRRMEIPLTLKTYTAMMHGWKMGKDYEKFTAMWKMLAESSIQLDTPIWTERVSGLIDLGRLQEGIGALGEMMSLWKRSLQEKDPVKQLSAVKPSIEVVNAAFDGLIRRSDKKAAFEVLEWAGREGIRPDLMTYNIMLRETVRVGQEEDVPRLLSQMREAGLEPDNATFTILLQQILGSVSQSPAEEQVPAVESIFDAMKQAKLQPNMEIYGKMMHAIAEDVNGSDKAIAVVEKHMQDNGITRLSPHIVLILLERLQRRLDARPKDITNLLVKYGFSDTQQGDQRLWEHVMSMYAEKGGLDRAFKVYTDLMGSGRPVTRLFCLRDMLKALIKEKRMKDADMVVNQTMKAMMDQKGRLDERRWRHHFFHLAHEHGLLTNKPLPHELQRVLQKYPITE